MPVSGRKFEAHSEGGRVIAALDQQRAIRASENGRIGEGGMPTREVVSDVDGHRGCRVVGELQPAPDLARVREVAEVRLREIGERRDGAFDEEAEGDGWNDA